MTQENKLSKEQIAEIEKEAEGLYPMPPANATNVTNFTTGFIKAKREAYTAAASKYLLQNKELHDKLQKSLNQNANDTLRIKELEDGLRNVAAIFKSNGNYYQSDILKKLLTKKPQ